MWYDVKRNTTIQHEKPLGIAVKFSSDGLGQNFARSFGGSSMKILKRGKRRRTGHGMFSSVRQMHHRHDRKEVQVRNVPRTLSRLVGWLELLATSKDLEVGFP